MTASPLWDDEDVIEFVSLSAGNQSFCIEITQIREIRRWSPVTALPYAEDAVLGVMNLRGAVIPIVDLGAKLELGTTEPTARKVVIVVSVNDRTIGLLVDSVFEILTVTGDMVRETPTIGGGEQTQCILGLVSVDDHISRILDLEALLPNHHEGAVA